MRPMPRGSSTCLGSLCAQQDPWDRLSFLLRQGHLSAQHACQEGTGSCTVLGCKEELFNTSRPSDCLQQHAGPLQVQRLLAQMAGSSLAKANAGRKADGTRQKRPTFAGAKHALLEQWDHDKNIKNGNFPDNTTLGSNKVIWWH